MQFDYSKLLGKIREYGYTQESLAAAIGISKATMSLKLNNKANFGHAEISAICTILEIPISEIGVYFFVKKVRKTER